VIYTILYYLTIRQMTENSLYTVSDVARILKLSTITVYKYIREKKLEAIEFSGHYRVSSLSLEKFISEHTIPATGEDILPGGKKK